MKLQLKRSAVLDGGKAKEPTAVQVEYGELCVNYNQGDPALFIKDSLDQIIRIAGSGAVGDGETPSGPTPPPTGNKPGDVFFDTTNNILMYWNGSEWVPIASQENAADIFVGTFAEVDAAIPVDDRAQGLLLWETTEGTLYIWYIDADTKQWVEAVPGGGGGGGTSVSVLATAPTGADQGDLWYCTEDGRLYVWYEDDATSQWVDASPDALASTVDSGENWPADAEENDLFFRTSDGRLYIYYKDTDSSQWIDASPDSQGDIFWDRDSATGTITPEVSSDGLEIGGSATFAGRVDIGSNTNLTYSLTTESDSGTTIYSRNHKSDGNVFEGADDAGTSTSKILADGSATFAGGDVTITDTETNFGDIFSTDGGTRILSRGELYIRQDDPSFGVMTVSNGGTAGTDQTFSLTAAGKATFGDYSSFTYTPTGEGVGIFPDGAIDLVRYNGGSDAAVLRVYNTTGSDASPETEPTVTIKNDGSAFFYRKTSTNTNSILHVSSDVNGTNSFQFFVTANGVISARSTAISQIGSERRIKNTIEPLDPVTSWETVRDLPYYSYKLNGNDENTYYGPIVDECPEEMVVEGTTSDEEGNIRTYDNGLLQGRLFIALQTALTRIEALEAEVQALKGGN